MVLANICLFCAGQFVQLMDIVQTVGKECTFLEHLCVITSYWKNHSYRKRTVKSTETRFVNSRVAKRVTQEVRFDGVNHFLGLAEKKTRCALCGSTTKHTCTKCGVKLHERCFSAFHGLTE